MVLAFCFVSGGMRASVAADDAVLVDLYGKGVHQFFAGMAEQAHDSFKAAIDGGSEDPRCYYFRGLTYLMLGREDEANADFAKGAEIEAANPERMANIGRSLSRIQGSRRKLIEKHRAKAREVAVQNAAETRKKRYVEQKEAESRVLLNPTPPAPPSTETPAPGATGDSSGAPPAESPPANPEPPASPPINP
jgi:Flp pilus assembly protein TadD